LANEECETRRYSIDALGKIGDKRAVTPLIDALLDPHWVVRSKAAEALGRIGDERATTALAAASKDDDWRVRYEAVRALGNVGPDAITPLREALRDSAFLVSSEAKVVLAKVERRHAQQL
jgi:HEAT repeat protein